MFTAVMRRRQALTFALAAVGAGVLFVDVCGLIFDCGCTSVWAGGAALCNVNHASGPHCPWCVHPLAGATAMGGVLLAQAGLIYGPLPFLAASVGLWGRLIAALLAFPLVAAVFGTVQGNWYGYWG